MDCKTKIAKFLQISKYQGQMIKIIHSNNKHLQFCNKEEDAWQRLSECSGAAQVMFSVQENCCLPS
jgi:hypothetical protein